ncbi:hypothetical protein GCM10025768_23800 [Microbacterium pseudoresistens]|uniref:Murein DD-endopeptidase MepM/ murein hydrolase activator NlpD n=2 Tax=Microbacterium pseudoresistens TaxID=640634 RepID=A0A7Y9EX19_9MICO|nr:M23 family metallopeptidase [Microbacterium pseudoresistens]NYD55411.1 murein DD-endopeptidase MepM/ murein hydrolase activator NlpD [Microbacterium pseudoresistens]
MVKAVGASLAVGALITGVTLPIATSASQATVVGASEVVGAQSYDTGDDIRAQIGPRVDFSATSEDELKEQRARAISVALASGLPLSAAVNIPVAHEVVMPLSAGSYSLTDGFGADRPGRSHLGQDFAAPVGTPIYAAMDGCVSISSESYSGYGVSIQLESIVDGEAISTLYAHMNYGTRAVQPGDCVTAGQYLGDVGSTGYVFGSCLHFEVHLNDQPIEPMGWMRKHVA